MSKFIDLTGQKFGRLTATKPDGYDKCGNRYWLCECECGNVKRVAAHHLKAGAISSCGCLRSETMAERNRNSYGSGSYKHGLSTTKEYKEWCNMRERCYNPRSSSFKNYGARGIGVYDEWKNDFQAFHDYVSKLPHYGDPGYTLDRIDNDNDYMPENVRWADMITQANNRRNNVRLIYKEKSYTISELARTFGIKSDVLRSRLRYGWSVEDAVTTPIRHR